MQRLKMEMYMYERKQPGANDVLWLRQMGLSSLVTDVVHVSKSLQRDSVALCVVGHSPEILDFSCPPPTCHCWPFISVPPPPQQFLFFFHPSTTRELAFLASAPV